MAYLFACARKDLLRRLADPAALLVWIGIPLVLGVLITLASGGGGPPRVRVLVVDLDESGASKLLVGALQQGGDDMPLEGELVELEQGRARMDDGDASALVVIPAGFADALLGESAAELQLITNPTQRILPGLVEETLRAGVDLVFYAQQLLGPQLELLREQIESDRSPTQFEVLQITAAVYAAVQSVDDLLLPPVLKLEVGPLEDPEPGAPDEPEERKSLALLVFPGMLLMSLLFVAQGSSPDLWSERRLGTLRRAACAPGGLSAFLLGKLLSTTALMGSIALLAAGAMCAFFELDPLRGLLGVLWATAFAAGFAVLMLFLQVLARSERGGGLITMLVLFPLLMLGGNFFPLEAMPAGLAAIGRRTPNGMALVELVRVFDGEVVPASLLRTGTLLTLLSLVLFALLSRRLRARFAAGGTA